MISVILPTLDRPKRFVETMRTLVPTLSEVNHEIIVVTDDLLTIHECGKFDVRLVNVHTLNAVEAFSVGVKRAYGNWFLTASDDIIFHPNWFEECVKVWDKGFVGLYEGVDWTDETGHFLISREFACTVMGGVIMVPHYKSWCTDRELCAFAKKAGRYAVTGKIVLDHLHYTLGKSARDSTYIRAEKWHAEDMVKYEERKKLGFPIDWFPEIKP